MARFAHTLSTTRTEQGYRVELPRNCDAIGSVLRDAYARDLGLPEDMAVLLRRMSSRPAISHD